MSGHERGRAARALVVGLAALALALWALLTLPLAWAGLATLARVLVGGGALVLAAYALGRAGELWGRRE